LSLDTSQLEGDLCRCALKNSEFTQKSNQYKYLNKYKVFYIV